MNNSELINKISAWIEFQQRSCIDAPYGANLIAYELKVTEEEVREAVAAVPELASKIR